MFDLRTEQLYEWLQTREPTEVVALLERFVPSKAPVRAVVIEDFVGSGPRDPNAILTIKYVGGFAMISRHLGFETIIRVPQMRRPFVGQSQSGYGLTTREKHAADALAHILSFIDFDAKEKETAKRRADKQAKAARYANGNGAHKPLERGKR